MSGQEHLDILFFKEDMAGREIRYNGAFLDRKIGSYIAD